MKLYNLQTTQRTIAEDIEFALDGGFLPQSLLFSGPRGSSRLTGALDLAFVLLGETENRELLSSGNIAFFSHREFYGKLSSAIALFERERTTSSRLFLIETVRQVLFQYHSSVAATSPSTMSVLFSLASDADALLMEYEEEREYSEKEVQALCSFLKSKILDPKFLYGGKRSPSPVSIDEIRGVQEWFASGSDEKIAIFEDVEDATEGAKNSLLKVLEEPDPHSHMILISSNPQKLMQTILSRVRKFTFPALTQRQVSELLKNRFHAWQNYPSFDAFFFQTGSGEEAQKELEADVALFTSSLISGKMMKKTEEEKLLSSLEKLSAYRYFKERVSEEMNAAFHQGKLKAGDAKKKMTIVNDWIFSSDIYNMSEKNALDLMLREAEIVK